MSNDGWDNVEHAFTLIVVLHVVIIIVLSFL